MTGALTGAISHRVSSGSWDGAKQAAIDGAATGFMTGAITGAITGTAVSSYCFVAGTTVLTATGTVAIDQIKRGDLVWSWDENTGTTALKKVVETYVNKTDELIHVLVNGEDIIRLLTFIIFRLKIIIHIMLERAFLFTIHVHEELQCVKPKEV